MLLYAPEYQLSDAVNIVRSGAFCVGDSEELYRTNLASMPDDWIWRDQPIDYQVNRLGYRMPEFEDIDQHNYFAVFGCSCTFGIGMPLTHMWYNTVAESRSAAVVNAASPGCGPDVVLANLTELLNTAERMPKFIVIQWPNWSRRLTWDDQYCPQRFVPNYYPSPTTKAQRSWFEYVAAHTPHTANEWWQIRRCALTLAKLAAVPVFEFSMENLTQWGVRFVHMYTGTIGSPEWFNIMGRDVWYEQESALAHPGIYYQQQVLNQLEPWLRAHGL